MMGDSRDELSVSLNREVFKKVFITENAEDVNFGDDAGVEGELKPIKILIRMPI